MPTYYVDLINGNDALNGLSFAMRRKTIGGLSSSLLPGDTVLIMESPLPVAVGVNSTWTSKSTAVTVASSLNVDVSQGATGWNTVTSGLTAAQDSVDYKLGGTNTSSATFEVAIPLAGTIFWKNLATPLNLAGYQQISLWVKTSQAFLSGRLSILLCTGLAGASPLYTVSIPAIPSTNQWVPVVVNLGVSMIGNIKSIAIQSGGLNGTTFKIDNVVACLPGSSAITHHTLIGKPQSSGLGLGTETWYAIAGITPTALHIDNDPNCLISNARGYYGTTETVALWARSPILTSLTNYINSTINFIQVNGTISNPITWMFGMNVDGMSLQNGETWLSGQIGLGNGLKLNCDFNNFSGLACVRYNFGLWAADTHCCKFDMPAMSHCQAANIFFSGASTVNVVRVRQVVNGGFSGFTDRPAGGRNDLQFDHVHGNNGFGTEIASNDLLHDSVIQYNSRGAYLTCGSVRIYRCRSDDNSHPLSVGTSVPGLLATYFNGVGFDVEDGFFNGVSFIRNSFTKIDHNLNFTWPASGNPSPGISPTYFSVVWEGYITTTTTETYTFTIVSDDGMRMWLDDIQVIGAWYDQDSSPHAFTAAMASGQPRKIRVEYFNIANVGALQMSWQSLSVPKAIVPSSAFSYGNGMNAALMVDVLHSPGTEVNLHDCIINEAFQFGGFPNFFDARIRSHNHDGVKGSHLMVTDGGRVINESGVNRRTLSGFAWNLMPTSPRSNLYPLDYKLASLAVVPNRLVTAKCYFKRTDSSITGQLIVPGGQLDGVPNDVITTSAMTSAWEELIVTFTPTEIGVIDVYARVFGGSSSSVFVDDMSVSQS